MGQRPSPKDLAMLNRAVRMREEVQKEYGKSSVIEKPRHDATEE